MSNRTYICIDCRTSKRAAATGGVATSMRCAGCSGRLWELSHRWRIPKKEDDQGWKELKEIVQSEAPKRDADLNKIGTKLLKDLDDRLESVSKQMISERRDRQLGILKKDRKVVLERYFPNA